MMGGKKNKPSRIRKTCKYAIAVEEVSYTTYTKSK
jgi:hypothetical protein